MKKTLCSLILAATLGCGPDCNEIDHYMPHGVERFLKETDFYQYVINNVENIKFVDKINHPDTKTGTSVYVPGCTCLATVSIRMDIEQNKFINSNTGEYPDYTTMRKNIDMAGTLVHEAAHCELGSSEEEYPNKKENEYYNKAYFVEDIEP